MNPTKSDAMFVTHSVIVEITETRVVKLEVVLPSDQGNAEHVAQEIAIKRAKQMSFVQFDDQSEEIDAWKASNPEATDLLDKQSEDSYTSENGRRWYTASSRQDVPDGIRRWVDVFEVAYARGLYRISAHEQRHGRETWGGGKVLYDYDTKSWKTALNTARKFIRRELNP